MEGWSDKKPTEIGWYWIALNDKEDHQAAYYDGTYLWCPRGRLEPKQVRYYYYPKLQEPK